MCLVAGAIGLLVSILLTKENVFEFNKKLENSKVTRKIKVDIKMNDKIYIYKLKEMI